MAIIFGVNSTQPSNKQLTNGYDLFHWVMRKNNVPAFWGRNITGENALTVEEIKFLHEKKCKLALIMNDLSEKGVSSNNGTKDALRAIEAAKTLNAPQNGEVVIFAEIGSDWSINHNWMISYSYTLKNNGFIPGFIGNTDSSKNFSFDRECGHYIHATSEAGNYGAVYGATEPNTNIVPEKWEPYAPSDLDQSQISLWRNGEISFRNMRIDTVYARDEFVLKYML